MLKGASSTAALDAELLMAHALNTSRGGVIAHGNDAVTEDNLRTFFHYIHQRERGTPVAYITGVKEFYGLEFTVTPDVLIPKPDTELLVELSLNFLSALPSSLSPAIADICCGSGCIGISIAHTLSHYSLSFTDISAAALEVCKANAKRLLKGTEGAAEFLSGGLLDVFSAERKFSLIVSNPPYVPSDVTDTLLLDGRGEPRLALDGGEDGLEITRQLVKAAVPHLERGGCLIIESSEEGTAQVAKMMKEAGLQDVTEHKDLSGQMRAAAGMMG